MSAHRKHPHIYEINLMTWIADISCRERNPIALKNIPKREWRRLKEMGMDFVWLMGMWQRSPDSVRKARNVSDLLQECKSILKDFDIEDITGSPYAVYDYIPDPAFGTPEDLLSLKKELADEGLFLILDFVPNHTACDHKWINKHPEYYLQHDMPAEGDCREGFFPADTLAGKKCIAHGKDPYFPPWTDTAQIDYSRSETMDRMTRAMTLIAEYGGGMRCDMAMLMLKDVFLATWDPHITDADREEFWPFAINQLRSNVDACVLLAEAYWGKETDLLSHGFDYVYDKTLYDLMVDGNIQGLKNHLFKTSHQLDKMVHFLENHDEPRALTSFGPERIKCAMVIQATLPGMRLWQAGQFEGRRVRAPVQLRRAPKEGTDPDLKQFSEKLLKEINHPVFHDGDWQICSTAGWPDNQSHENLMAWCWRQFGERRLIITNFSFSAAQGFVKLPTSWLPGAKQFIMTDLLNGESFVRSTAEADYTDVYVALDSGAFHFFRIERG